MVFKSAFFLCSFGLRVEYKYIYLVYVPVHGFIYIVLIVECCRLIINYITEIIDLENSHKY